jgi:V/A-type H+-transporting ATPase subunit G/H
MYLEEVQSIRDAEEAARRAKADAITEAKTMTAEAEEKGRKLLAESVLRAEEECKSLLRDAENRAAEIIKSIEKETSELQEKIRTKAEAKLDEAALLIVERIIKSQ